MQKDSSNGLFLLKEINDSCRLNNLQWSLLAILLGATQKFEYSLLLFIKFSNIYIICSDFFKKLRVSTCNNLKQENGILDFHEKLDSNVFQQ